MTHRIIHLWVKPAEAEVFAVLHTVVPGLQPAVCHTSGWLSQHTSVRRGISLI